MRERTMSEVFGCGRPGCAICAKAEAEEVLAAKAITGVLDAEHRTRATGGPPVYGKSPIVPLLGALFADKDVMETIRRMYVAEAETPRTKLLSMRAHAKQAVFYEGTRKSKETRLEIVTAEGTAIDATNFFRGLELKIARGLGVSPNMLRDGVDEHDDRVSDAVAEA